VNDTYSPILCPHCGSAKVSSGVTWIASSEEPCDPGNVAQLEEWHCQLCERSFWCAWSGGVE
jgi:hypothetical protein